MNHLAKKNLLGFILCIVLTLMAYDTVASGLIHDSLAVFLIVAMAVIQALVQLVFFLDLGEKKEQWNLLSFISTIGLIAILVAGTLIIMYNLNHYHTSPQDEANFILHDEGIKK